MTDSTTLETILDKLRTLAVPMDSRDFSNTEYNRVFPRGTVDTPIGEVKIGQHQFSKMADKDKGNRRGLIGAMPGSDR